MTATAPAAADDLIRPEDATEAHRQSGIARKLLLAEGAFDKKLETAIRAAEKYCDAVEAVTEARAALDAATRKASREGIPSKPRDGLAVRCAQSGEIGWAARRLLARLQRATAVSF